MVTNNELEPRQGNIAEDVNVLEIVQETASEFAVKNGNFLFLKGRTMKFFYAATLVENDCAPEMIFYKRLTDNS